MPYEISDTVSHHNEDMRGPESTDQFIVELDDACPHAADETDSNGYETEVIHDGRNCYAVIELDVDSGEYIEKLECCISEEEAIRQTELLTTIEGTNNGEQFDNIPLPDFGDQFGANNGFPTEADDAQRRADMMPSTYTYEGQFTPAQQETRRRFAAVSVALADDGFDIDAPANAHIGELLERWATAWAEASK
jgi:hypothetical protein